MFKIPTESKKFIIDNASMSRGNIYSAFNIMFDADKGRIKLNPPLLVLKSSDDNADFVSPTGIVVAEKNGGGGADAYILTTKSSGFGGMWSTTDWGKLAGANAPAVARDTSSDICLWGSLLCCSTASGFHYVPANASAGDWTLIDTNADWKGHFILVPFVETGRLYMFFTNKIVSIDSSYTMATSGSFTQVGLANITCGRASSKRIWYATQSSNGYGDCKIYEWDGVSANPLNIFTIPVSKIHTIVILNDVPIAIDQRGRFWFYDGYNFKLKDGINIPSREDDFGTQTITIHRNGSIADKGKVYVLVGSNNNHINTTERALSGIWCYDPEIGLYHYSSPDNISQIYTPYALSKGSTDNVFVAGYLSRKADTTAIYRVSATELSSGVGGTIRMGFITTQFLESSNLTDIFNSIGVRYRKMIYSAAQIEVKYRTWKNIECNATITWTSANTFTVSVASLDGTSTYCTPVAIGDEVMVQDGANTGLIAQIINRVDAGATATITIDRNASVTSGTGYAMFSNYTLLKTITNNGSIFTNIGLNISDTMIQVKLVMSWKGYYDEIQEILASNKVNEPII